MPTNNKPEKKVLIVKPVVDCGECHGWGIVYEHHPEVQASEELICDCVAEQISVDDENAEIQLDTSEIEAREREIDSQFDDATDWESDDWEDEVIADEKPEDIYDELDMEDIQDELEELYEKDGGLDAEDEDWDDIDDGEDEW